MAKTLVFSKCVSVDRSIRGPDDGSNRNFQRLCYLGGVRREAQQLPVPGARGENCPPLKVKSNPAMRYASTSRHIVHHLAARGAHDLASAVSSCQRAHA